MTEKWPVLTYGPLPRVDRATWNLHVFGEVGRPIRLDLNQLRALPSSLVTTDFHCVTGWSKLDNGWGGVLARDLIVPEQVGPAARFALVTCEGGYTTNLTLSDFLADNVLFAYSHNGADLPIEHGGPVRLVVPNLYGWKSAKWVRSIELTREDRPGFWEVRGYHNHGDPWTEERYS